jgi:trimethylamine---corrinoid protein Co-methyltransferase
VKSKAEIIHTSSLEILETIGVRLHHPLALKLCADHGFKLDGNLVFFESEKLMNLISLSPSTFTLHARNSQFNMQFGLGKVNFAPGYGAPSVVDDSGRVRNALFDDYKCFLSMIQSSEYFDINGGILVQPSDIPAEKAMSMMVCATISASDKSILAPNGDKQGTDIMFALLEALFGYEDLLHTPRVITLVSTLTPLQIDEAALNTLLTYSKYNQPVMVTPTVMAGSTGPITLSGTMALANAEALAGIALVQMAKPGCPVMYGCQNTCADMKTGGISIGSPERVLCVAMGAEMASMYNLPYRGGGSDTDAHGFNAQAGMEGMMTLMNSWQSGTDLIVHSAGILSGYAAMSYEKFIMDLEMIGMLRRVERGIGVSDEELALDVINAAGIGGQFLTQQHTFKKCRQELYAPRISKRGQLTGGEHQTELQEATKTEKNRLLESYRQPALSKEEQSALRAIMDENGLDFNNCLIN